MLRKVRCEDELDDVLAELPGLRIAEFADKVALRLSEESKRKTCVVILQHRSARKKQQPVELTSQTSRTHDDTRSLPVVMCDGDLMLRADEEGVVDAGVINVVCCSRQQRSVTHTSSATTPATTPHLRRRRRLPKGPVEQREWERSSC